MSDTVFCSDCKWFVRNGKDADSDSSPYDINEQTGAKTPKSSYFDCGHLSNRGKYIRWWGIEVYYKKKPSMINANNDCRWWEKL